MNRFGILLIVIFIHHEVEAQTLIPIGEGWAGNTVNTVIFRKNSVVSYKDIQYAAYYDSSGHVVLAKRYLNNDWEIKQTTLTGNIRDAHNSISIMTDGEGYLHISWDHHGHPLHYTRTIRPGSLELMEAQIMTGMNEMKVTYPEFYRLPNGDILFLYRDGGSGNGNLVLNRYDCRLKKWDRINNNLLDGEGKRNAYWQAFVDIKGTFHISWVWRESPDVASNHDMCYAKSNDGGNTWKRSDGKVYTLPINAVNAEYIHVIPQENELINSTSMTADEKGRPFIATYWRPAGTKVPQYHLVYFYGNKWNALQVSNRKMEFSLSGAGTKKIPISRPQVLVDDDKVLIVFRDRERNDKVSVLFCNDINAPSWNTIDLANHSVGQWEPSFDTELWKNKKELHLFVQRSGQGDGEKIEEIPPQMVNILEWKPVLK